MQTKKQLPIEFITAFERGVKLASMGNEMNAETAYSAAAKACPEAWLGVACVAMQEGKTKEAMLRFEQVLASATHPKTRAAALNNMGSILCNMALRDEAMKYYEASWDLWKHQDSAANRAIVLRYQNRLDEAEKWIDRAIRIKPTQAEFYFTRALIRLTKGNFAEGFRDYESRWKNQLELVKRLPIYRKEWNGENLNGKTILIYGDQGAGDTIQMLRYAPRLKSRGARVLLAPQQGLGGLAERMGCFDGIHEDILQRAERGDVPAYDYQVSTMSLPRILGEHLETLNGAPYLPQSCLSFDLPSEKMKVGIVWAGSIHHKQDRWRSTHLEDWSTLFDLPNVQFYSLQVGQRTLDLKLSDHPVIDLSEHLTDYQKTAAAIEALDLVIAVDTSVVHLCGAMGRPVWMLTPFSADWRWLTDRDDSPWYDSLRIFRQSKEGEWGPVFDRIKIELSSARSTILQRERECELAI